MKQNKNLEELVKLFEALYSFVRNAKYLTNKLIVKGLIEYEERSYGYYHEDTYQSVKLKFGGHTIKIFVDKSKYVDVDGRGSERKTKISFIIGDLDKVNLTCKVYTLRGRLELEKRLFIDGISWEDMIKEQHIMTKIALMKKMAKELEFLNELVDKHKTLYHQEVEVKEKRKEAIDKLKTLRYLGVLE